MITVPVIVLGFMLQWLFGVKLHWLPVAGVRDGPASYVDIHSTPRAGRKYAVSARPPCTSAASPPV